MRLIRPLLAAAGIAAALGCIPPQRSRRAADPTWAPTLSFSQLAAMGPTLAPDSELQMQLPVFGVHQEVLPSGLRLGVETGETRGMVAVVTVFGSGSSADPPDHEGVAHLVEHLVYHSHAKGERPLNDRLLRLGAQYNADTSVEMTRFHEVGPASALTRLLEVAAERMLHPLAGVDEEDFTRERAIVENELNQRNELGVYGEVVSWMQTALLPAGHPHARPIGGNRASLRRLTLADARNFAATHYRPSNAAVLVTGEPAMTAEMSRVASRLPASVTERDAAASRTPPATSLQTAAATLDTGRAYPQARPQARPDTLKAAIALPEILIAYDLGGGGYDTAIAKILTAHAAETALRERLLPDPDVIEVSLRGLEVAQRTWLACEIVLKADGRRQEIAAQAQALIWGLWSDAPPRETAWERWQRSTVLDLRQAALADAIFDAEPFLGRALDRASAFHATGAVEAYDRVLATIAAVRTSDLSGHAFALLARERAHTLFLEPLPEAQRPDPGRVGVGSSDNLPMATTRQRASELGAPPRGIPPAGLHDAKVMTLMNGLTVVLVPRRQFPSVTALLGFHGGSAALPLGVLELVRIVEDQTAPGPRANKMEVAQLDGRGFTADFVRTDRRRLSNALKMLAERLKTVAETDWFHLLSRAQSKARQTRTETHDDPRTVAGGRMQAALYGAHPYGRRLRLTDMLELDPALAPEWLPQLYNPRNGVLVIVGDIDVDVAAWLVSGWFGDWQSKPGAGRLTAPPVPSPGARPTQETVQITHRPVTSQVEVVFACRLASPTAGRERAAQRVLAGLLGAELTTEIREKAGATYSVSSGAAALPAGGAHLAVTMSVDTRRLRDALRVLHAELDDLAAGRIDKGAVSQIRWALAGDDALDYQTGANTAGQILRAFMFDLPLGTLVTDPDELGRVSEQDVARAFAPCVSSRVLSLVGDEPTIRATLWPSSIKK